MVLSITLGQFNDFLEDHISSGLVSTVYTGSLNPLDDDFWLLLHNYPLSDQHRTFAAIIYPESEIECVISEGVSKYYKNALSSQLSHTLVVLSASALLFGHILNKGFLLVIRQLPLRSQSLVHIQHSVLYFILVHLTDTYLLVTERKYI
jgi:hypothetical protein